MSHITTVELKIKDLGALDEAAKQLGLELVLNPKDGFSWFAGNRSPCDHKLRVKHGSPDAYEIGLVRTVDEDYELRFDPFAGGHGMMERVASRDNPRGVGMLLQRYATEVSKRRLRREGYVVRERVEGGVVHLEASR